ncbi:hypothetical protein HMPREF1870_02648 [Bacteroidales bacterium KA00344]|nr:hypothetical protein HMPREF1870_02648 [Bacteroidales bacterium KA00344]
MGIGFATNVHINKSKTNKPTLLTKVTNCHFSLNFSLNLN